MLPPPCGAVLPAGTAGCASAMEAKAAQTTTVASSVLITIPGFGSLSLAPSRRIVLTPAPPTPSRRAAHRPGASVARAEVPRRYGRSARTATARPSTTSVRMGVTATLLTAGLIASCLPRAAVLP